MSDYIMPFLIIICLGVIVVLLISLWRAIFVTEDKTAAYLHVLSGSAEMKTWGTNDFFSLASDVRFMNGDVLRSAANGRMVVDFFDGTVMRVDGGTELVFKSMEEDGDDKYIELELVSGALWFNREINNTTDTKIIVSTSNVSVHPNSASIFTVENGDSGEVVRVVDVFGKTSLQVDILSDKKIVETENIGVGQEIVFSDKVLERYRQFQSPTVLAAISDDFKETDWYAWNVAEDENPTEFVKYAEEEGQGLLRAEPVVVEPEVTEDVKVEDGSAVEPEEVDENAEVKPAEEAAVELGNLAAPVISSVQGGTTTDADGFYKVTGKVATLSGTVSGAAKVVVNGYTLTKFKAGDTTWTYFANADYGLMREGQNSYEIIAYDASGKASAALTVKVLYEPVVEPVTETPAAEAKPEEAATDAPPATE